MKKLATIIFLLTSIYSIAQIDYGQQGLVPTDSNNFENISLKINIDTTNSSNDWIIGSTNKPFFGQANSLPNAIMTDSLSPYSSNNLSYFDIGFSAWNTGFGFPMNLYMQFDHKYETDTLIDGGFITVSHDSGQTWENIINDSSCVGCYFNWPFVNSDNLYTTNDTLMNGHFGFSGTSNWKTTTFQWVWMLPVKQSVSDSLIIRFNFISDNNQTNKDGWIIDNIVVGYIDLGGSVEELDNRINIKLYPNITSDYFNYKVESNEILESMIITNTIGQTLYTIKNPKQENKIDISKYPSGNYFVKFSAKGKQVVKKLIIN